MKLNIPSVLVSVFCSQLMSINAFRCNLGCSGVCADAGVYSKNPGTVLRTPATLSHFANGAVKAADYVGYNCNNIPGIPHPAPLCCGKATPKSFLGCVTPLDPNIAATCNRAV
ncbi:hypothetical protein DFH28DRAFT_956848 [Melampsora americana]|nr:hypothetical protein DFH28DRAFT_956848 [Melampsora americana]